MGIFTRERAECRRQHTAQYSTEQVALPLAQAGRVETSLRPFFLGTYAFERG